METLRIMSVFGTRPEAIKMAPLVKELAAREGVASICCVTAQHREMLDSVLAVFDVKPDWDLDIMTPRQTLSTITSKCLMGMDEAVDALKPHMILVHGDTSTTFAGALSAFYHQIPVGHVEAGLRTYDKYSPYPEEMNRKLVTAIADLYFCPTQSNRENLRREGVTEGVFVTGNTVIDALKTTVRGTPSPHPSSTACPMAAKRSCWSHATAGRTTGSPWRTSCPPWRRSPGATTAWSWSTRST